MTIRDHRRSKPNKGSAENTKRALNRHHRVGCGITFGFVLNFRRNCNAMTARRHITTDPVRNFSNFNFARSRVVACSHRSTLWIQLQFCASFACAERGLSKNQSIFRTIRLTNDMRWLHQGPMASMGNGRNAGIVFSVKSMCAAISLALSLVVFRFFCLFFIECQKRLSLGQCTAQHIDTFRTLQLHEKCACSTSPFSFLCLSLLHLIK